MSNNAKPLAGRNPFAVTADYVICDTANGYCIKKRGGPALFVFVAQMLAYITASLLTAFAVGIMLPYDAGAALLLRGIASIGSLWFAFHLSSYAQSAGMSEVTIDPANTNLRETQRTITGRRSAERKVATQNLRAAGLMRDSDAQDLSHLCLWTHDAVEPMLVASGPAARMEALCAKVRTDLRLVDKAPLTSCGATTATNVEIDDRRMVNARTT